MSKKHPNKDYASHLFSTDDHNDDMEIDYLKELVDRDIFVLNYFHGDRFQANLSQLGPGIFTAEDDWITQFPMALIIVHQKYQPHVLLERAAQRFPFLQYIVRDSEGHVLGRNVENESKIRFMGGTVNRKGDPVDYFIPLRQASFWYNEMSHMTASMNHAMHSYRVVTFASTNHHDDTFDILRFLFDYRSPFFR
jgi:hypothetical protein